MESHKPFCKLQADPSTGDQCHGYFAEGQNVLGNFQNSGVTLL